MNTQSTFKSEDFPPDKKLDTLRNGIAHEGKGISKEIFRIYQPLIETHYQLFCSQDPFLELNHFISGLI